MNVKAKKPAPQTEALRALGAAVRGLTDAQRVNTEKLNKIAAFLAQLESFGA